MWHTISEASVPLKLQQQEKRSKQPVKRNFWSNLILHSGDSCAWCQGWWGEKRHGRRGVGSGWLQPRSRNEVGVGIGDGADRKDLKYITFRPSATTMVRSLRERMINNGWKVLLFAYLLMLIIALLIWYWLIADQSKATKIAIDYNWQLVCRLIVDCKSLSVIIYWLILDFIAQAKKGMMGNRNSIGPSGHGLWTTAAIELLI